MLGKRRCCCGGCTLCVIARTCAGTRVEGATVTFKRGSTVVGTCTTGVAGDCCLDISGLGAGAYNVSVAKTGLVGSNRDVTVSCPSQTVVSLGIDPPANSQSFIIKGCNFLFGAPPLDGAVITIGGGSYATSGGLASMALANGTYPFTVSMPPRFDDYAGSLTVVSCSPVLHDITLSPASDYHCYFCSSGPLIANLPIKKVLNYSDSVYGLVGTATYNGATNTWDDPPGFAGPAPQHVDVPAGGICAAATGVGWRPRLAPCIGVSFVDYTVFTLTGCPKAEAFPAPESPAGLTLTSAGFSPDFVATFTSGPNKLYPGVTSTITLYE